MPNRIKQQIDRGSRQLFDSITAMSKGILTGKEVQTIMRKGAKPAVEYMQSEYNKLDSSDGDVNLVFDAVNSRMYSHTVWVGPGKASRGRQLAHLYEYGSVARYMKKGLRAGNITQKTMKPYAGPPKFVPYKGKYTGIMPAGGFMRRGFSMSKKSVIAAMRKEYGEYLNKQAKRIKIK